MTKKERPAHKPEIGSTTRGLRALGLSPREADVYVTLIDAPKTTSEVALDAGMAESPAARTLDELVQRGFVNRLPGTVTRFSLAPPEWVLSLLLRERESETEQLRLLIENLGRSYRRAHEDRAPEAYVEMVVGVEAVRAQLELQFEVAQREIASFTKLPLIRVGDPEAEKALARGVRYRFLYERETLESPNNIDLVQRWAQAGEEVRTTPKLPSKLIIFDRERAVIHVTEASIDEVSVAALVTRHPEVVETLYHLFELLWDAAIPVFEQERKHPSEGDDARKRLIACLAAGMNDVAMMRTLDISRRTLSRRINDLQKELKVGTRFQAGFKLGLEQAEGLKKLQ